MESSEVIAEEVRLKGTPVSEGIAIGTPYFLSENDEAIPEFPIAVSEVDTEIARYRQALLSSREDLSRLRCDLATEGPDGAATFIDTHIQMLNDEFFNESMISNIRKMLKNTESVFHAAINEYEGEFTKRSDTFFQERLIDVRDVSKRILGHLRQEQRTFLSDIPQGSILFAHELAPSHTAAAKPAHIVAFVTQNPGGHSHAALIARANGIPFVGDIDLELAQKVEAQGVIVDGQSGEVIFNPTLQTLRYYREKRSELIRRTSFYETQRDLSAETMDGFAVRLYANIGGVKDLSEENNEAHGVGLFRTEYLFLEGKNVFPTEDEQVAIYLSMIEQLKGRLLTIRVFDIGGDKHPELFLRGHKETIFGQRGIRFLLKNETIFRTQVRAIFRAAKDGAVRILLPLISDVSELLAAKVLIEQVRVELNAPRLPIGCMIEVPSAVMVCDRLAAESDFLSLGTNDLVQYTLGIDRASTFINDLLYSAHPSILRMIKMICVEAKRHQKPITICGEIASSTLFTPLLLGLGLSEFSCAPRYLPALKETIRRWSIREAYDLAGEALRLSDRTKISELLNKAIRG